MYIVKSILVQKNILFCIFLLMICLTVFSNVKAAGKDYMYGRDGGDGYNGKTLTNWNIGKEIEVERDSYAKKFFMEVNLGDEINLPLTFGVYDAFEAKNVEGKYLIDKNLFEIVSGCETFSIDEMNSDDVFDIDCKIKVKENIPSDFFESEIIHINSFEEKLGDKYVYKSSYKNIFIRFPENEENKRYFNIEGCVAVDDNLEKKPLETSFSDKDFNFVVIFLITMFLVIVLFTATTLAYIYLKQINKKIGIIIVGTSILIFVIISLLGFKNFNEKEKRIEEIRKEINSKELFNNKLNLIKNKYKSSPEAEYVAEMSEWIKIKEDIKVDLGEYVGLIDTTGNSYFDYPKTWDFFKSGGGEMSRKIVRAPYADGRKDPGVISAAVRFDIVDSNAISVEDYVIENKLTLGSLGCEVGDEENVDFNGYEAVKYDCSIEREYSLHDELARKKDIDSKSKIKYTTIVFKAKKNKIVNIEIEERDNCGDVYRKQIEDILDSFILLDVSYDKSINNK